jgi:hypothetical protein
MSTDFVTSTATGRKRWAIAEGYLADAGVITDEEHLSKHETLFLLNAGDEPAHVKLSIYFADRPPLGPYPYTVEPRRTVHLSLESLDQPAIPRGCDFASLIESDAPIVVLATRRRTSSADDAPLSKIAFSG